MASTGEADGPPLRTDFVDGIRGLSALWVATYHAVLFTGATGSVARELPLLWSVARHGWLGVPVFIVVSGYVLMLPVAKRGDLQLPRGARHYLWRRARRILPPYYAALVLSLLLIGVTPAMQQPTGTRWDDKIPVDFDAIWRHALLVQDLSPATSAKINGPMWSVALEWHIYFLMPLVLLPLWRRIGAAPATAVVVAAVYVLNAVGMDGWITCLWLVGLFALGMFAAHMSVQKIIVPGAAVAVIASLPVGLVTALPGLSATMLMPWTELLVGLTAAAAMVWLSQRPDSMVASSLRSRPVLGFGVMSYSFYLLHSPLLALGNLWLMPAHLPIGVHAAAMLGLVLPGAAGASWVFHLAVERRFLTSHQNGLVVGGRTPGRRQRVDQSVVPL